MDSNLYEAAVTILLALESRNRGALFDIPIAELLDESERGYSAGRGTGVGDGGKSNLDKFLSSVSRQVQEDLSCIVQNLETVSSQ